MYYIYFAVSQRNGKCYVGYTSRTSQKRVDQHNSSSSKWSSQNNPLKLVYFESYHCKADAISREKFYKSGVGKRVKYAILREFSQDG